MSEYDQVLHEDETTVSTTAYFKTATDDKQDCYVVMDTVFSTISLKFSITYLNSPKLWANQFYLLFGCLQKDG